MKEKEVRKNLDSAGLSWDDFCHWMRGQTCGIDEDGETDFYDYDVNRFIKRKGFKEKPESPFEFD